MSSAMPSKSVAASSQLLSLDSDSSMKVNVHALIAREEAEVLAFLARRPIHTSFITGLIHDNGLVSPFNRGSFYGFRNSSGHLEGVALIGRKTIIETNNEEAQEAFAHLALKTPLSFLLRGERSQIERLKNLCEVMGRTPRLICRELLLAQNSLPEGIEEVHELRPATEDHLQSVVDVNAKMFFEENGVNPLKIDPEGMRQRVAQRIEQRRVWTWVKQGRLIFKADVITETPEAAFIEGVYVHTDERGKGIGLRCMTQLARHLLQCTTSLSLIVNEENLIARALYRKAGYEHHCNYSTLYFSGMIE